jgi:purine-cytosine permease-like protein
MAILALVGFDAVKKVTKLFLPILFLGGVAMLYIFITDNTAGFTFNDVLLKDGDNKLSTFIFFASLSFVQYISGVSAASDMTRYAKTQKQAFWGLFIGNGVGFFLTAILGAYTAAIAGSWNPYIISIQFTDSPVFILIIFIAAVASMISINLANAYIGGYSLLNSIPKLGRIRSAIIFGVVAIVLSGFPNLVEEAKAYLSLLGALIIPLSAVIVSDFWVIKKLAFSEHDFESVATEQYRYNVKGLFSMVGGMILYVSLPETVSPGFTTFVVVCVFYLLLKK